MMQKKKNKNILVLGAGGVGISLIQSCKIKNSKENVVVDLHQLKLNFSKNLEALKRFYTKIN